MSSLCQDIDGSIFAMQRTERVGISGFEKFLFTVLVAFSLLWIFYLRHFTAPVLLKSQATTFEIELYRPKPDPVSASREIVQPEPERLAPVPIPEKTEPLVTPEVQKADPQQEPEQQNEMELREKIVELYKTDHPDFTLPDSDLEAYRPDDVFDPRLADKIARQRKKNSSRRRAQSEEHRDEVYFDNMGVLNYRKGNTCFQLIEIPGIGHQWYGSKCAIIRYEMEFEFNGKRY